MIKKNKKWLTTYIFTPNIWYIRNRTKLSSALLLCLVRFLIHQTLWRINTFWEGIKFWFCLITRWFYFNSKIVHYSNLSSSLDSKIVDWYTIAKTMVLTVLDQTYEQFLGQCIFCLETLPVIWFNHKLNLIYFRWNDEKLYQESRRIVTAEWQHVVYNEWLPIMLGQQYMTRKELMTSNNEFWICQSRIFSIKFADHFHLIQKGFFSQNQNRQKISTDVSVYAKVSLLGVDSLWGDCRFIPADWGS